MEYKLDDIIKYKNEHVVYNFTTMLDVTYEESEDIFKEMLKWLYYCNSDSSIGNRTIDASLLIIDEMWHNFIFFTSLYRDFCDKYFGKFIHHSPSSKMKKEEQRAQSREVFLENRKKQMNAIYDFLGKETFIKWYHVYPDKYSKEKILALRIK